MQQIEHCQSCGNSHPGQLCSTNSVSFFWKYGGKNVYLYGTWKNFQVAHKLERSPNPPYFFETTQYLLSGTHEYKFLVDNVWMYDMNEKVVYDGHGSYNNVIEVIPRRQIEIESDEFDEDEAEINDSKSFDPTSNILVKIRTTLDARDIKVCGSWDGWKEKIKMKKRLLQFVEAYENYQWIKLKPGEYEYKFIIGKQWIHDPTFPNKPNYFGSQNNIISVRAKIRDQSTFNFKKLFFQEYTIKNQKLDRIQGHSMTCLGSKLYIFGGLSKSRFSNKLYDLDISNFNLIPLEVDENNIPEGRAFHHAIQYGNKIIFYGGLNSQTIFDDYYVYNTTNQTWSQATLDGDVPQIRERATLTLIQKEDLLVYFGGYYCKQMVDLETMFNDVHFLNLNQQSWKKLQLNPSPEPRYAHAAVAIKSSLFIIGGQGFVKQVKRNYNDIWKLELTKGKWVEIQAEGQPPKPRHGHSANVVMKNIIVFGGVGETSKQIFNDVFIFDIHKNVWSEPDIQGLKPCPRYYHAAEVVRDKEIFILGGNPGMKYLKEAANLERKRKVYILSFKEEAQSKQYLDDDSDEEYQQQLEKLGE